MTTKNLRKLNALVWFMVAGALMLAAHKAWSQYGVYTMGSFLCSLLVHGGICLFIGSFIDGLICKRDEK